MYFYVIVIDIFIRFLWNLYINITVNNINDFKVQ